eukprot:TRINITY_DN6994_c0_g2_i1.p1 TRINITY_DN6994_c0_g2~~TRINITY_DN6994_c0_g2_i1.p1  ORF type:complete len:135 (-),score=37.19 TRINITY_DN6994_c0_g2_i1:346-750(-)
MQKATPPKKPLTPFFMFKEREREKGVTQGAKEAGIKWKKMTEAEKQPYIDAYKKAKMKYDKYLEEVEGLPPKGSSRNKDKPTSYKESRIRATCGRCKEIMQINHKVYKGLGRVLVSFSRHSIGMLYARFRESHV